MNIIYPVIFPELKGQKAGSLDMAAYAQKTRRYREISPFLDSDFKDRFLAYYNYKAKIDYSWGGYLEDRGVALRGSYLSGDQAVHYGIDLWVGAGTAVSVAYPCHLVSQTHDPDQNGGFGGVVFLELDNPVGKISHVLYAHLAKDIKQFDRNESILPGDIVGRIGKPEENGGWPAHLHVQAMMREAWELTQGDLTTFDGYGAMPEGREHPLFPDPQPLL